MIHSKIIYLQLITSTTTSGKRTRKPIEKLEPSFEATYKRRQTTLSALDLNDNDSNLDLNLLNFDQLMSCMEQNLGHETGELNLKEENEIFKNLLDLNSPDPKSQAAIDQMPESKRKRFNDATIKEFEGMQKKEVMEYKRMSDLPRGTKSWNTKKSTGPQNLC